MHLCSLGGAAELNCPAAAARARRTWWPGHGGSRGGGSRFLCCSRSLSEGRPSAPRLHPHPLGSAAPSGGGASLVSLPRAPSYTEPAVAEYSKELDVAVRVVQMACSLCQGVQAALLGEGQTSVQAAVSWLLAESFPGERVSIVAEEDVRSLLEEEEQTGPLLDAVVSAVNGCLREAAAYGLTAAAPPEGGLGRREVLEAIGRCNSAGARRGGTGCSTPSTVRWASSAGTSMRWRWPSSTAARWCWGAGLPQLSHEEGVARLPPPLLQGGGARGAGGGSGGWHRGCVMYARRGAGEAWMQPLGPHRAAAAAARPVRVSTVDDPAAATFCEPVEKANSSHAFAAGLARSVGLRWESAAAGVQHGEVRGDRAGDAEIFMKFGRSGYREKIWDHAAGVLIVQEAGGVVTDAGGRPLDFSRGIFLDGLDRGIVACSGASLHAKIIAAVDASWDSSEL
ncbi:unnamed protein product [Spirodela intermedia]|uniref:Uncharacterized protein n=1 Tax=Spirodela intermedia TaxID=51605 RepID=A0A7I8JGY4_SPIIN|nr:unnamed protein product [Spirodela intermedia]CAA6668803.1 unnamed protein product [Spirodela intermedia]